MGAKGKPKTPGSGRKKNSINKDSIPLLEKAKELNIDPFEILLHFAAGDWEKLGYESKTITIYGAHNVTNEEFTIQPGIRAKAAAEACQYLYPKRKSIEFSDVSEEKTDTLTVKLNWADENASRTETQK